mgnify:CR=1 FL=1
MINAQSRLAYNQWNHVAVVRNNNIETFYINGYPVNTRTHSLNYPNESITIGAQGYNNFEHPLELNGFLQDIRISTKAVYTGCFVPPTALFDCNNNVVSTPTPTQTPIGQQDPTPTPTSGSSPT